MSSGRGKGGKGLGKAGKGQGNGGAKRDRKDNEVSSVRVIKGKKVDFRCTICGQLPRILNRSELYRLLIA